MKASSGPNLHSTRIEGYGRRSLSGQCPPLERLLHPGARILDVGSNVGSITREIANLVRPGGSVVGVDVSVEAIAEANRMCAADSCDNVEFRVASAYDLPFADASFDMTVCLAVLNWLRDPVRALREQARVTRPGGMIAASFGDRRSLLIQPDSPALMEFFHATERLAESADDDVYLDGRMGREASKLFEAAGIRLVELSAYVPSSELAHRLSGTMGHKGQFLRTTLDENGPFAPRLRFLLERNAISPELLARARAEVETWVENSHSLWIGLYIFALGVVGD